MVLDSVGVWGLRSCQSKLGGEGWWNWCGPRKMGCIGPTLWERAVILRGETTAVEILLTWIALKGS